MPVCPGPRVHPGLMGDWNRRCRRRARSCGRGAGHCLCDSRAGLARTWAVEGSALGPRMLLGSCPGPTLQASTLSEAQTARGPEEQPLEQVSPSRRLPTPGPCGSVPKPGLLPGLGHPLSGARLPEGVWPVCPQARGLARGRVVRCSGSGPECVRWCPQPCMGLWGRDGVWGPHLYSNPGLCRVWGRQG